MYRGIINMDIKYKKFSCQEDIHNCYIYRLIPKLLLLLIILALLFGCSSKEYVYVDTHQIRSEASTALLVQCRDAEVGQVGETNISLAKAYLKSNESLYKCKAISDELIKFNDTYLEEV